MHLTQVHMENFKSFGQKLTVPFEPGFTGITGPNGSGKSNIGDAILFVLGPNSPRAIRAGRLTDLIFNGGAHGKPASYTEVSLNFDNRDRTMPIDADDVELTRKVKRAPKKGDKDGYNSYFYVNGRASKKREFVSLLEHARISADGYNITQQGDVLDICKMTPVQRRGILDSISGVASFDGRLNEAGKQQTKAEENLERIGIVLEEIERSLSQLEKEKGAAQRYKDLQENIGTTKAQMAWRRKIDLEAQIATVAERIQKITDDRAKVEEQLALVQEQHHAAKIRFAELEQDIRDEGGEEVQKIQDDAQAARDKMVRLEEKIHFVKDSLHDDNEDLLPLQEQLRKAEKELGNTLKLRDDAAVAHDGSSKELADSKKDLDDVRTLISQSDDGAMAINRELSKLKHDHEHAETDLHKARLELDRVAERKNAAQQALVTAQEDLRSATTDLEEVTWELGELQKTAGGSEGRRKELDRRRFDLKKAQAEANQQAEDLEGRIRRLNRELAELQAQEAAAAKQSGSMPPGVAAILKAREDGLLKGVVGTINELASAEAGYETALETAAGGNMHAVVVDDDAAAAECIAMLKRTGAGRAKMLPLNKMVPGRPRGQALMKVKKDGCLGFALDLIEFNERYHAAFWHVFGDTLVVGDMNAGRRLMGGVRMVTKDGELFEAAGAMVGGKTKGRKGASFNNADRSRMDEALGDLRGAEDAHELAVQTASRLRNELHELEVELAKFGVDVGGSEDRLKGLIKRHGQLDDKVKVLTKSVVDLDKSATDADNEDSKIHESITVLESQLKGLEQRRAEKGKLLLKGSKKEWRDQVEQLEVAIQSLTEAKLSAENRRDVASKQAELVNERVTELKVSIEEKGGDRSKFEAELKELQVKHTQAKSDVEALMKMEKEATKGLRALSEKRDVTYRQLTDLQAQMEKFQDRMETHYGLLMNQKAKLPSLEEQLGEALVELREFPLPAEETLDLPAYDDLRRRLRNYESQVANLGAVNMRALEEFEEQSQRKADLDAEVQRLHQQLEELVAMVEEISLRKKGEFMTVFEAINENFSEVYKGLSLGGKAYMELENSDDPFDGGLILKAQPMGKRVTRLDSLSGGEKSLTSMALIFAIQQYNPSPFYYFDEVDQNLDAVNSELLAKMVKENSKLAQFIVVSLRKITLKEASFMYGVTQEIPGQSEVIANFDLAEMQEPEPERSDDDGGDKSTLPVEDRPDSGLSDSIGGMMEVQVRA
jgi:chromosome segregation protein